MLHTKLRWHRLRLRELFHEYLRYKSNASNTQFGDGKTLKLWLLVSEKPENREKKRFLYGISMGGGVALLLHRKEPTYWDGAVLLAPMCKVRSWRNGSTTSSLSSETCRVLYFYLYHLMIFFLNFPFSKRFSYDCLLPYDVRFLMTCGLTQSRSALWKWCALWLLVGESYPHRT